MYLIICIFKIQDCSLVDRSALHVAVETVPELKQFLLENYSVELSPATNHSFTVGYVSDGRTKCDIKTDKQLEEAYLSAKNGWITLWVDPHSTFKRKKDEKERREGRGQA